MPLIKKSPRLLLFFVYFAFFTPSLIEFLLFSIYNFNSSVILDIHPVQGLLLRLIDKVQRIRSFTNDKQLQVSNESVEDACEDIVNYAILAKAMLTEERKKIEQLKNEEKKEKVYSFGHGNELKTDSILAD